MDIRGIVKEVGYFETARNLCSISGSSEAAVRVSSDMPMPPEDAEDMLQRCADMILERKKKKVFFLTPEIALIEKLAACPGSVETVLIALSSDLDEDMCSRIGNNLMKNMDIRLIREPFFPEDLYPKDGLIAVSGFLAGERTMVSREVYRMTEHYGGFLGQKIFLPYVILASAERYDGWLEISPDRFSAIAGREEGEMRIWNA